jgi:deaminated glutathione amidase
MRAAAIQINSTNDVARNLEVADHHVRAAAADGATLVVLPEKWSVLGTGADLRAGAQPLDGEAISWARATARELGIDLIAGSISERIDGEEKLRNTSVHIGPDGEIAAVYRKLHLFDVEVEGTRYAESENEDPGTEPVLTTTADGVDVGMSVCYDVRFPELYRILAAFTLATTRDHWEVLLRARAIENQSFVIAPNQIGEHPPGNRSGGRSMIIDPWGLVLAVAPDKETHVIADLDMDLLAGVRERLPALRHARPELLA